MMYRATVGAAKLHTDTDTVSIPFSVIDPNLVYNGYVWFFDSSEKYLGGFFYFRDPVTGFISPTLTGSLFVGGTDTLSLASADLTLAAGVSSSQFFANAAECVVVLTDGAQYSAGASHPRYDGQSISARTDLTIVP
jgi:hypothetical protein